MSRRLVLLGLIVVLPRFSSAQFTTFIPPRPPPPKPESLMRRPVVAKKKEAEVLGPIYRVRLAPMKQWVDSAVGIRSTPRPPASRDTADTSSNYPLTVEGVTSVRHVNATVTPCQNPFVSPRASTQLFVPGKRSSPSRARCSRRDCRFRRIARPRSEWSARSNDGGRSQPLSP